MARLWFLSCLLLLTGCGHNVDFTSPQRAAIGFFDALYNDNDSEKAMLFVSPELKKVMTHYQLASQIQRHVIGLSLDHTQMTVESQQEGFFDRTQSKAQIQVLFKGEQNHRLIHDARLLTLEKQKKRWVIIEISDRLI